MNLFGYTLIKTSELDRLRRTYWGNEVGASVIRVSMSGGRGGGGGGGSGGSGGNGGDITVTLPSEPEYRRKITVKEKPSD